MIYQNASAYFLNFLGNSTYKSFVKRAYKLHQQEMEKVSDMDHSGCKIIKSQYSERRDKLKKQFLIYSTLDEFCKDGKISEEDRGIFKRRMSQDKIFSTRIRTIFDVYSTPESVQRNKDKVLYHIKSSLTKDFY